MRERRTLFQSLAWALTALLFSFAGCSRQDTTAGVQDPPVTIRLFANAAHNPILQYAAGPWRDHEFISGFDGSLKAQAHPSGEKLSVNLLGTMTWKNKDVNRATIAFHLENTEPVIVELLGMHPDKKNAPEAETVIRQTFAPGSHDFSRGYWVLFTYKPIYK